MKVIRDTIHGDIELTADELQIVHTSEFQRLHGCRQLGLTYLVYPGAKHSRFEHVLGVMHVAARIAKRLEEQKQFFRGTKGARLLKTLRLAALLHDMGHVPFGHTLEDEMPLIQEHDLVSEGGETSRMESTVSEVLLKSKNDEFIKPVLGVLHAISKSKDDAKLYKLVDDGKIEPQWLVLADIIGNTICADLLDYIRRDHLMTGIRAVYDDRIFQYFAVAGHSYGGKSYPRLIIRLVKNGRVRHDCLADLLDILKLRYNLSDKVLFHPKKCAADAMLIRAVADLHLGASDLLQFSDDGFLDKYRNHPLLASLRSRTLFKPVFVCRREHIHSYNEKHDKKTLIERLHKDLGLRRRIETKIDTELGLSNGKPSVLIFCPHPDMTFKPIRTLVQWSDGTIRRLNGIESDDDALTHDQVHVLQRIYLGLWKLYLFVRPDLRSRGHMIREKFVHALKTEAGLEATCDPAFGQYLEDGCMDYRMGRRLDEELERTRHYQKLPSEKKLVARAACHARLPLGSYDEDFIEIDVKTIASKLDEPALVNQLREIVHSVLEEAEPRPGHRSGLHRPAARHRR
jgi:HD superfamily phosphohydrolase